MVLVDDQKHVYITELKFQLFFVWNDYSFRVLHCKHFIELYEKEGIISMGNINW
jgi:hypothetical protein